MPESVNFFLHGALSLGKHYDMRYFRRRSDFAQGAYLGLAVFSTLASIIRNADFGKYLPLTTTASMR